MSTRILLLFVVLLGGCSAIRTPPPTASGFAGGEAIARGSIEGTGAFGSGVLLETTGLPDTARTAATPSLLFAGGIDFGVYKGFSIVLSGGVDMDTSWSVASGRMGVRGRAGPVLFGIGGGGGTYVPWTLPFWFAGGEVGVFAPISDMFELGTHVRLDFSTPTYAEPANTGTWVYVQPSVQLLVGDGPARMALGVGGHFGGRVVEGGWATRRFEFRVGVVARTPGRGPG